MKKLILLLVTVVGIVVSGCTSIEAEYITVRPIVERSIEEALLYTVKKYNFDNGRNFHLYNIYNFVIKSDGTKIAFCDLYDRENRIRCKCEFKIMSDFYTLSLKEIY